MSDASPQMIALLAEGRTIAFRPKGNSMTPVIKSGQVVTVEPVDPHTLRTGDVVLARVRGTVYLHLVSAIDRERQRVQISNNHGRINGWTSYDRVYGILSRIGP